jgi:hypothetical protein
MFAVLRKLHSNEAIRGIDSGVGLKQQTFVLSDKSTKESKGAAKQPPFCFFIRTKKVTVAQ